MSCCCLLSKIVNFHDDDDDAGTDSDGPFWLFFVDYAT